MNEQSNRLHWEVTADTENVSHTAMVGSWLFTVLEPLDGSTTGLSIHYVNRATKTGDLIWFSETTKLTGLQARLKLIEVAMGLWGQVYWQTFNEWQHLTTALPERLRYHDQGMHLC